MREGEIARENVGFRVAGGVFTPSQTKNPTMLTKPHFCPQDDPFYAVRQQFELAMEWLSGAEAPTDHRNLENGLQVRGNELMRLAYQAQLDKLSRAELHAFHMKVRPQDIAVRSRTRQLMTLFGRVQMRRLGWKSADAEVRYPLDEQLNLPADMYSYCVRERISDEGRRGSWEQAIRTTDRTTAAHVPKRQAEEITVRAAQDFGAFYAEHEAGANDALSANALLVLSSDSKGITMRPESLRDATRKDKDAASSSAVRVDPMAPKKLRKHDKRMAVVTAVWDQERHVRTPEDIVGRLRTDRASSRKPPSGPKPQNKRLSATVEQDQKSAISAMFDEAERRDPDKSRTTVVLVDGEERQIATIQQQAKLRNMRITIVLDVIHVLHYLWMAGFALCRQSEGKTSVWVATHLLKLFSRPAIDVVAGIRQSATLRGLTVEQRRPIEKCAKYLLRNAQFLRYGQFVAEGFPIATGVIEGACRHLIQDRLGITGARWNVEGAEAVLRLRALHSNGDWDAYWNYHVRQESRRNYATAA